MVRVPSARAMIYSTLATTGQGAQATAVRLRLGLRCACVCLRSVFEHLRLCSALCLLRPSAPVLLCLGVISGAGGLPLRLDFSCVCAERVPVAPCCLGGSECGVMHVRCPG